MSEQQLDGAQVGAGLEQMDGESMAQRVRCDRPVDAGPAPNDPAGILHGRWRDRLAGQIAWEQPSFERTKRHSSRSTSSSFGESMT